MNKRKEFSKLNLLDRFLFDEVMEDSENMKTVLDIILGQDIPLRLPSHSEKEMRTFPDNRQVRLDVYAWDDDDTNGGEIHARMGRKRNRTAKSLC